MEVAERHDADVEEVDVPGHFVLDGGPPAVRVVVGGFGVADGAWGGDEGCCRGAGERINGCEAGEVVRVRVGGEGVGVEGEELGGALVDRGKSVLG